MKTNKHPKQKQAPAAIKQIVPTQHAVVRAAERYTLSATAAEALIASEVAVAFSAGRTSVHKPMWARGLTAATHALPFQTYAWGEDKQRTYVVDTTNRRRGQLRVITCLVACA